MLLEMATVRPGTVVGASPLVKSGAVSKGYSFASTWELVFSLSLQYRKDLIFLKSIVSPTKITRGRPIGGFIIHSQHRLDLDLGFCEIHSTKSSVSYI